MNNNQYNLIKTNREEAIQILLIEDNLLYARLIEEMLSGASIAKFEIKHVVCLNDCMERLKTNNFDIILLDLDIPDSSGFDTFIKIRNEVPHTPIVLLTEIMDDDLGRIYVMKGAQDYLVKGELNGDMLSKSLCYAVERMRMELTLKQIEGKNHHMVENLCNDIWGIDKDKNILDAKGETGTAFSSYLFAKEEESSKQAYDKKDLSKSKGKILVMDDEEMVGEVICSILRLLGYETAFVKDGLEAIEAYKEAKSSKNPFVTVILDLTIPGGMGGTETIKRLQEFDPDINVIVSSGYCDDLIIADFKNYGFKGIISKPYNMEEIEKLLNQLLQKEIPSEDI